MGNINRAICAGFVMVLLSLTAVRGAEAADGPGLAVGEKAPAFTLKAQDGKERSLGELLGEGRLVLVFHRSADW